MIWWYHSTYSIRQKKASFMSSTGAPKTKNTASQGEQAISSRRRHLSEHGWRLYPSPPPLPPLPSPPLSPLNWTSSSLILGINGRAKMVETHPPPVHPHTKPTPKPPAFHVMYKQNKQTNTCMHHDGDGIIINHHIDKPTPRSHTLLPPRACVLYVQNMWYISYVHTYIHTMMMRYRHR